MNPSQQEVAPPAAGNQPPGPDPELLKLYRQTKRTYTALFVEDEIDKKVIILLKLHAKHEPNPANPPITLNDAKDLMTNIMNVQRLIEDKSYHIPTHQPLMPLRKFMQFRGVDYAGESFKQVLLLSQEELDYIQLMHHLRVCENTSSNPSTDLNVPRNVQIRDTRLSTQMSF